MVGAGLLVTLLACGGDGTAPDAAGIDPARVLLRASMDLRGVRPTPEELDAVEADPSALSGLLEDYLHDPRFPARVRALWAEVYRTRTDGFLLDANALDLPSEADWVRDAGDEPLRVLGEIAATDAPWTDLVTGDTTLVSPTLAAVYPVETLAPAVTGDGWMRARWTDGRPAAGLLSGNGLWVRHTSTPSNAQRGRANTLARIFLCQDFLAAPIAFAPGQDLLDESRVRDALRTDPACTSCHRTLDPLASFLFGFTSHDPYDAGDSLRYHPEREPLWRDASGVAPGYYGEPLDGRLDTLGRRIAADPRFARCAAEQAWTLLARRPADADAEPAIVAVREAFVQGGATARALARAVVTHPEYAAGEPALVTPAQLASQVRALTGFVWRRDGVELLDIDAVGVTEKQEGLEVEARGVRTLAGGVDGDQVTRGADRPNVPMVLVQARLAEAAAGWAVREAPEGVFPGLTFAETPGSGRAAMEDALVALHRRLYGAVVPPDGVEVQEALALWEAVHAVRGDPREAWAAVLTALLRDPRLLVYG